MLEGLFCRNTCAFRFVHSHRRVLRGHGGDRRDNDMLADLIDLKIWNKRFEQDVTVVQGDLFVVRQLVIRRANTGRLHLAALYF